MINMDFDVDKFIEFMDLMDKSTDEYFYLYDMTNNRYRISSRAVSYFDIDSAETKDADAMIKRIVHPDDYNALVSDINRCKYEKDAIHNMEYRWKNKEDGYSWISCRGNVVNSNSNLYLVGRIAEISKHRRIDGVTSLYSFAVLTDTYSSLAKEEISSGYLLLIGVDNFKEINEKYGVSKGDEVLSLLASIIKRFVTDSFRVFRMNGDEIAVIIPEQSNNIEQNAKNLYKRIRNEIDYEIERQQYQIFFNISGGAVAFDAKKDDFNSILRNVRFTLHSAKIKGKNRFVFYTEEQYQMYIKKLELQDELRQSINNNFDGFELYYQPIYGAYDGKIKGAEALIRWNSSKYGFMSPVQFIPLLEDSSLIIPLGKWIFETAASTCNSWITNVPNFIIHINLSYIQIIKSNIIRDVLDCISRYSASNNHYVFEITESFQMDSNDSVKKVLEEFGRNKFNLAIDDFGTGYSNFSYMQDKLFNIIKIDRSFVTDINVKKNNYLLVDFIIRMSHQMGLKVCIEGVETKEELDCVKELDADYIQGYFYGKPVPYNEFIEQHLKKLVIKN